MAARYELDDVLSGKALSESRNDPIAPDINLFDKGKLGNGKLIAEKLLQIKKTNRLNVNVNLNLLLPYLSPLKYGRNIVELQIHINEKYEFDERNLAKRLSFLETVQFLSFDSTNVHDLEMKDPAWSDIIGKFRKVYLFCARLSAQVLCYMKNQLLKNAKTYHQREVFRIFSHADKKCVKQSAALLALFDCLFISARVSSEVYHSLGEHHIVI